MNITLNELIRKLLRKVLRLINWVLPNNEYYKKSYSLQGEDMILATIFANQKKGVYVDVGAYHPIKFSNTYYFYKLGWTGINIDAMPDSMRNFKKFRKRDINLEIGISEKENDLIYYALNSSPMSTFSEEIFNERIKLPSINLLYKKTIKTVPLYKILDKYLTSDTPIDLFSIDVEGFDLQVLKSNNWDKYIPKVIVVESNSMRIEDLKNDEITKFLLSKKYEIFSKSFNSVVFLNEKFLQARLYSDQY